MQNFIGMIIIAVHYLSYIAYLLPICFMINLVEDIWHLLSSPLYLM